MPSHQYRKVRKIRSNGISTSTSISFGAFGLRSLEGFRLSEKTLEAARKVIMRYIKLNGGVLYVKTMHKLPVTKKPLETRMGSGKGGVDCYVYNVKKGSVLFEIDGVSRVVAKNALEKASAKLSTKCTFISKKFIFN